MLRCLAHLGVFVTGLAILVCCGCGEQAPKGASPAKNADQGVKGDQPAAGKPTAEKPDKPAPDQAKPDQPKPDVAKPDVAKPAKEDPDTPAGETGSTAGRGGRAVGKVLRRLMEESNERKPAKIPPTP